MASTSEELSGQAEQLIATLEFFKIEGSGNPKAGKSSPAPTMTASKTSGKAASSKPVMRKGGNAYKRVGMTLDLSDGRDKLDEEFEQM